jgi:hypothetical protein
MNAWCPNGHTIEKKEINTTKSTGKEFQSAVKNGISKTKKKCARNICVKLAGVDTP